MKKLLNEIAEVSAGQGAPQGDENYSIDGTPFVKAGNLYDLINGESIDLIQKVNDDIASKYRLKKFPAGTVVFAKSGMSCLKGYVYVLPTEAYVVNHLACIVPYFGLSEYLKFYFMHHKPSELIKDSSYPSIRLSDISDIVINLPELSECMNIVKILKNTERIIKIKKLQLLEFDQLIKSRFVEMFGDIFNGKSNYPKIKISEAVVPKIERANKSFSSEDKIKYVDISSVDNQRNIIIGYTEYLMKDAPSRAQQHVRKDDIIISTVRPNLNNVAKVPHDYSNIVASSGFCVLRASKVKSNYLFAVVSMQSFADYLASLTTGANYPAVSDRDILNFEIPNAPIEEQIKFSDFIKQIDKLKFAVQKSIDETQKLFDSLMQEYFG